MFERFVLLARSADDGLDAEALASVGIDLGAVRERAEQAFGHGALGRWRGGRRSPGRLPLTRGSKASLQHALRAAIRLGDRRIDSGHLVLGVLAVDDDVVRRTLSAAGTGSDELSADVERRLRARAA